MNQHLRSASHYFCWVKRTLDKLSTREQGRSPLKYINCGPCISLERKSLSAWGEFGCPLILQINFPPPHKLLAPKLPKVLLCRCFGDHCTLTSNVKAQWTKFYSPPIKLLESFVFSTDGHSVKRPWSWAFLSICHVQENFVQERGNANKENIWVWV